MSIVAVKHPPSSHPRLTGQQSTAIVMAMVTISKSLLKARMLEYFRQVEQTGEELVVTSDGQPVLKVVPYAQKQSVAMAFADVRGNLTWSGDLNAPTQADWTDA